MPRTSLWASVVSALHPFPAIRCMLSPKPTRWPSSYSFVEKMRARRRDCTEVEVESKIMNSWLMGPNWGMLSGFIVNDHAQRAWLWPAPQSGALDVGKAPLGPHLSSERPTGAVCVRKAPLGLVSGSMISRTTCFAYRLDLPARGCTSARFPHQGPPCSPNSRSPRNASRPCVAR
jgi:hypothetical protein